MKQRTKIQTLLYRITLTAALLAIPFTAHTEYLELPIGRAANLQSLPRFSVETGLSSGEYASVDYEHQGIRISFKPSTNTLVYGNLGKSSIGTPDATSYGAGFYYEIRGLMRGLHSAFRASYNTLDLRPRR